MNITGIDLSLRHCGLSTICYKRTDAGVSLEVRRQLVVDTEYQGRDWWGLLKEIGQMKKMILTLSDLCQDADYILVEIPTMGGKPNAVSVRTSGMCYGLLAGLLVALDKNVRYVQPSELKLWSGKKTNKKEHVEAKVIEKLGRVVLSRNNNIIDSLGLCLMKCDELSHEHHKINGVSGSSESQSLKNRRINRPTGNVQQQIEFLPRDFGRTES